MKESDHAKRRRQYREYREKRRQIKKEFDETRFNSHKELIKHIEALDAEYRYRGHNRKHRDFEHYYRNFKLVRPLPVIFILILWALVFFNSGLSTSIGVLLLVFTILVTAGSLFQLIFTFRLEKRILKPIDNLKKGMEAIANGNYDIEVKPDVHSYIDTLIKDFNDMARKLKETEKLKAEYEENRKDLIANISHDLKTPITSIQGYIEAVTEAKEIPAQKLEKYLKIIHNNIVYINRLIDDLFLFSKLDMQKLSFEYKEVLVRPFMRDLMEEFKLDLEERHIAFSFADLLSGDVGIRIDAKRFHQVLRNIIDNAVKYGPDTGLSIKAELYSEPELVCVSLTDNGPGIPPDQLGNIFKRFYRLDNQRTKDITSTGLGLAIAKELIEMQGGRISADNAQPGGTRFTVRLPVLQTAGGIK